MTALDVLLNIISNNNLASYPFKYCLVSSTKHPMKIDGTLAKPNNVDDFVSIDELTLHTDILDKYKGLGISIQGSDVCAIDLDDCVKNEFDTKSINIQAKNIIDLFKDVAYIEFSFSGHGIRILFKAKTIENYEQMYYIKNSKLGIEFYHPKGSARYVTITGKSIFDNKIEMMTDSTNLIQFLDKYMKRPIRLRNQTLEDVKDNRTIDDLMKIVKAHYFKNNNFQELWFTEAPGSGKDESERDYHLVAYLFENVTQDRDKLKEIFEQSKFFKTKDWKHMNKWTKSNYRYYNYLYDRIRRK